MSHQYDLYLCDHIANVQNAFEWLQWNMPQLFKDHQDINWRNIADHDSSKMDSEEYQAYDAYFYGNKSAQVVKEFKKAWLLHIHRNPHHWQYWVLNCDEPDEGEICLDMPYKYIIEMICDWWSFSFATGDLSEIFDWYDKHQDYIKLSDETRKTVEDILWALRERLGYNVMAHHGIKGQKWGIRRGPPYPLDNSQKSSTIVSDAIASGEVSKTINREKQNRHTLSDHTPGRSYLYGDLDYAQELVDTLSGTGKCFEDGNGHWNHKEMVVNSEVIGAYIDPVTGEETDSRNATIIYSKTGTHIYPRRSDNK